ncbi:MAG: VWA domain-containing protein [Candidatus Aenigmarchaeota archaeon]|nr:VWA domain-containing protein [Candidatus Aenigmarchaeota archaeon]
MSSKKGQFSFLTKGFLMIFMIIAITLIINQVTFYQINAEKISKEYDLSITAMNLVGMLSNSERCLALNEEVDVGGITENRTYSRIIDLDKVIDFTRRYSETEPECARNYMVGYNVTVDLVPINISYDFTPEEEITVLQHMLEELEGRNAVFVIDMSSSMEENVGQFRKVACVRMFLEGFVNNLEPDQRIAIVGYGSNGNVNNEGCNGGSQEPVGCVINSPFCGATTISSPTIIGGNENALTQQINSGVVAKGCTPMAHGLSMGFSIAESNGFNDIVLLTDGCENCAGDSVCLVQKHLSSGIRVHSIAFGQTICPTGGKKQNCVCAEPLQQISSMTGGRDFIAKDCRELIRPPNSANATVEKAEWSFGTTGHSEGKALDGSIMISLPVMVKRGNEFLAGFIRLSVYDGDLESVSGLIEYVCRKGTESNLDTFIDLPMSYDDGNKMLCMTNPDGTESCRKINCDSEVVMNDVKNPGRYKLIGYWKDGKVNIVA